VHRRGDGGDVLLEQPEGVRVGQHDAGHVVVEHPAQRLQVDAPPVVARDGDRRVAPERHRRRVRAVGRVGDDHLRGRPTLRRVPRPHQQQTGQLPRRPGGRLQGDVGHAGDLAQGLAQAHEELDPTLRQRGRRRRVHVREPRQRRGVVAQLRVVLHGAGPERVGAEVHGVLAGRQPREVGHEVALGHLGQRERLVGQVPGRHQLLGGPLGQAGGAERPRPPARGRQLEDRRLLVPPEQGDARRPAPGRRHRTTFCIASA
jgi:hypothetical protein